uniref:ANK_REP_REGION domain-containing protein n=1 Tax=Angiostrongylus cantonensis TaxID=6313 RepID=A0A158P7D7_ANGCA
MDVSQSIEPPNGDVGGRLRENMKLYDMVDLHGGGEMMTMMRYAKATKDYSFVDHHIKTRISEFLLNNEKGKLFPITELVTLRNKERNAKLAAFLRKKGKGKAAVNVLEGFDQNDAKTGDLRKALKLLDGGGKGGKSESKYRELNWKLEERDGNDDHSGTMGETIIGVCLLQGTTIHNMLALRILDFYPKLVNDICTSEDYYGLSPLHQAIINHDVEMVSKLLQRGADVNQSCVNLSLLCYGAFFCADDQKSSRTDSLEHEYVELTMNTNYTGTMYFGEYPLSFAVCMNHPDLFRLLLAKKANLHAQDTNGNTVLHLCVIHEKIAGARLNIANKQNLTPLTLAAKLAKKKCCPYFHIFNIILELEGQSVWVYGESNCFSYPLTKIDTINEATGEMNEQSALSLVVYGKTSEHLELLEGILEKIIEEKWKAFGKRYWLRSLFFFIVYYIIFTAAYMLRPISATTEKAFPAKLLYKVSFVLVLCEVPIRFSCHIHEVFLIADNVVSSIAVLLTTLHFLFYCRAIPFIGPFVLMVYTIIATDLTRFFMIYSIFLVAFYIIFTSCERKSKEIEDQGGVSNFENVIDNPFEALLRTFIMTIGEFATIYKEMASCESMLMNFIGKMIFLIFEIFVSILQFNLLIAMMTRTYEAIFETKKEWNRQWAQVILMLELSLSPKERLMHLLKYSRPTGVNKRIRSYVVNKKTGTRKGLTKDEEVRLLEEKAEHIREEKRQLIKKKNREQEIKENSVRIFSDVHHHDSVSNVEYRTSLYDKTH